jgi:hypothetical protein
MASRPSEAAMRSFVGRRHYLGALAATILARTHGCKWKDETRTPMRASPKSVTAMDLRVEKLVIRREAEV